MLFRSLVNGMPSVSASFAAHVNSFLIPLLQNISAPIPCLAHLIGKYEDYDLVAETTQIKFQISDGCMD